MKRDHVVYLEGDNTNRRGFYTPDGFQQRDRRFELAQRFTREEALEFKLGVSKWDRVTILQIIE